MDSFSLKIKPVYSALASQEESDALGSPIRLARHQVATINAYRDPGIDIIFNTAMTGDGKTLAAYLPACQTSLRVVAAYPTNELIRDQRVSVESRLAGFGRTPKLTELNSKTISQRMADSGQQVRASQVKVMLDNSEILLTNPDLFHLLLSYNYGHYQRRDLVQQMQAYDYYILDEFHIFGPPQVIAVINIISAITVEQRNEAPDHRLKFIFLSATPHPLMERMLRQSGLEYHKIEGEYSDEPQPDYRRILAPCNLSLVSTDADNRAEKWVYNNVDELLTHYRTYPGSKGAIIVNSVAVANRLVAYLEPYFKTHRLTVLPNTGLTDAKTRADSYATDLLVGTSTIDVGVDFKINLLIFEANSDADFLQRFGRLGRHPDYPDASYRAYALCPAFICARIAVSVGLLDERGTPKLFDPDAQLSRLKFSNEVIPDAFPDRQQFDNYAKRWGLLQAAPLVAGLEQSGKFDTDNYSELRSGIIQQLAKTFSTERKKLEPADVERAVRRYHAMSNSEDGKTLLGEVNSFRGNTLSCAIWDGTDGELKTYNLLYILANTNYRPISKAEFMAEVSHRQLPEDDYKHETFYLKVDEYLSQPRDTHFKLAAFELSGKHADKLGHAVVLPGFSIKGLPPTYAEQINAQLRGQRLVCTITSIAKEPIELRRMLGLSFLFPAYLLRDRLDATCCVSFGKQALLLDSLLWWRRHKESGPTAYIV